MVPWLQDLNVLWFAERAQSETHWLDKSECIPCVHHIIQIGHTGPSKFSAKEMEIFDLGRSAKY